MNNLNDAWCHNWDKEKALYEENLQPLENAFKDALMKIPQEKRLQMGGMLIDDLWNDVYQKHFPYQKVTIGDDGKLPEINRSLLRHKRSRSGYYNSATGKPRVDEGMERLALLIHHNCVLKPVHKNESAFSQTLRTVIMQNSSLIRQVISGSPEDWGYLEHKYVEPVSYCTPEPVSTVESPTKVPFFSKERWKKATVKLSKSNKMVDASAALSKIMLGRILGERVQKDASLTKPTKKTFVQKVKSFKFSKKIDFNNLNPKKWFKSQLAKFSKPINKVQPVPTSWKKSYNQEMEKTAIEFLKSARGQV